MSPHLRTHALSLFLLLCFGLILFRPGNALAAGHGVYIAPKFVYAYTVMDPLKLSGELVGSFGFSASGKKNDHALGGALAVGYNFDPLFNVPIRAEIEYAAYSQVKGKISGSSNDSNYNTIFTDFFCVKQQLDIQTLFLNAYYDIKTGTPFTPWLGAGAGMAFVRGKTSACYDFDYGHDRGFFEGSAPSRSTTNFAWNVGLGVGWKVAEQLIIDLGYRFVSLGGIENGTWQDMIGYTPVSIRSKTGHLSMHQVLMTLRVEF